MGYLYVAATVLFTVYGQLILKWRVGFVSSDGSRLSFFAHLLQDPWVISAFASAGLASLTWMLAVSQLPLSRAYPLMASAFALVIIGSAIWFAEPLTVLKVAGIALIFAGMFVGAQG